MRTCSDYHVTCGILVVREIFCRKLVVVDMGNEISVAVTGKRTLRDRAERCRCAGKGGNTARLAQNGCL